ncbi:unnamed protein product [Amoebophrya sp. A120]|nr:unnamed protein product [Amoebophrya sp. A120]|eukprot:GSA120T00024938001.1
MTETLLASAAFGGGDNKVDGSTSAAFQKKKDAALHNVWCIIVYNFCSAISIGTALGPFFEKYVLQVQQAHDGARANATVGFCESLFGFSQLLVFWPVGLVVDRQPERRNVLARWIARLGLGAVFLLGSAFASNYLPFIYVAMVILGIFYEGLTSSSETLFADSVQILSQEGGSTTEDQAKISADWFTKKMIASYSGVAFSPVLGILCVEYFRHYVSPMVMLTRGEFADQIGVDLDQTTPVVVTTATGGPPPGSPSSTAAIQEAVPPAATQQVGAAAVDVFWNMDLLHFILILGLVLILPAVWKISGLQSVGRSGGPKDGGNAGQLTEALLGGEDPDAATKRDFKRYAPYVIAVADFAQCIGAGMTFKYFNLFFIQDFGFGPNAICVLQIVYPLCMVFMAEVCNRVLLPLFSSSRAKVSMVCRLVAILGLWLIGGAFPFSSSSAEIMASGSGGDGHGTGATTSTDFVWLLQLDSARTTAPAEDMNHNALTPVAEVAGRSVLSSSAAALAEDGQQELQENQIMQRPATESSGRGLAAFNNQPSPYFTTSRLCEDYLLQTPATAEVAPPTWFWWSMLFGEQNLQSDVGLVTAGRGTTSQTTILPTLLDCASVPSTTYTGMLLEPIDSGTQHGMKIAKELRSEVLTTTKMNAAAGEEEVEQELGQLQALNPFKNKMIYLAGGPHQAPSAIDNIHDHVDHVVELEPTKSAKNTIFMPAVTKNKEIQLLGRDVAPAGTTSRTRTYALVSTTAASTAGASTGSSSAAVGALELQESNPATTSTSTPPTAGTFTSWIAGVTYYEPAVLVIFLVTGSFAMATPGFDKSILMDHVATENRGKWNALLSFNGFAFRGSALFGGVLADGHSGDYRPAFTYAAAIYVLSSLLYAPLMRMVRK